MYIIRYVIIGVSCIPLALMATLFLAPFWKWLEVVVGVESIGHSGPAEWCYFAIYGILLFSIFMVLRRKKRGINSPNKAN